MPLVAAVLAAAALVVPAAPASAHVDLDPVEATAGSTIVLSFSFHHGPDGGPTTSLAVQVPPGAEVVDVPGKEGWTSTVEGDPEVVTWSGGEVPDGVEERFDVEVRLPAETGEVLFPAVQDGPAGELAWIEVTGGATEADRPAPRLLLVADPDGPPPNEAPTTAPPTDAAPPATAPEPSGAAPRGAGDDDGSVLPWLLGGALLLALVAGAAAVAVRRRA